MTYKIAYISYDADDKELKNHSISILNIFFDDKNYEITSELSSIIFIGSGGSENLAKEITKSIKDIVLLCHKENNSYAATMEIASYLRNQGKRVSIIDVMSLNAFEELVEVQKVYQAIDLLSKQRAAVIGEVSDWLINSDIEDTRIKEKLGIEMLRLPWDKLDDYRKQEPSQELIDYFPNFDKNKLEETSRVYKLLKNIVSQYKLSAISVECFSMVRRDQVTACLPLAVLNTKNIVAACEGDVCSMIGKMIILNISGIVPWQANVAHLKDEAIFFAHCTAPLTNLETFNITTHYESNCGTAIQGQFKKEPVGAFRINSELDSYMLLEGEITETPNHSFACRTQIEFSTTKEQTDLLKNKSLGNHHLIFPVKYVPLVIRMMDMLQIKRVD